MSPIVAQDLRRDATTIVCEQQSREVLDVRYEDFAEEDEIVFMGDREDEDQWIGLFQYTGNSEKIYEVSYRFSTQQFFVTDYVMLSCTKADSPHIN